MPGSVRHAAGGSPRPSSAQTPTFHSTPTRDVGARPRCRGPTGGRPATRRRTGSRSRARQGGAPPRRAVTPCCRAPGGPPARRVGGPGPGRKSATARARWSIPSRRSTTTPSIRRSSPHTFSTSSASWMPSTQRRPARATRAGGSGHRHGPGGGDRRGTGRGGLRPAHQCHRPSVDAERARGQPEDPLLAGSATQFDAPALDAQQGPAEPAGPVDDRHADGRRHLGEDGSEPVGGRRVDGPGQDARGSAGGAGVSWGHGGDPSNRPLGCRWTCRGSVVSRPTRPRCRSTRSSMSSIIWPISKSFGV